MYPYSSQKKYWTFASDEEIIKRRVVSNLSFIEKFGSNMTVNKRFKNDIYFPVLSYFFLRKASKFDY